MNSLRFCIGFWACLILSSVVANWWMRGSYLIFAFVFLALDMWPQKSDGREGFWAKVWRR